MAGTVTMHNMLSNSLQNHSTFLRFNTVMSNRRPADLIQPDSLRFIRFKCKSLLVIESVQLGRCVGAVIVIQASVGYKSTDLRLMAIRF